MFGVETENKAIQTDISFGQILYQLIDSSMDIFFIPLFDNLVLDLQGEVLSYIFTLQKVWMMT